MWKNSQSLSVDGCQTVSSSSESLPGWAPGGIGTAIHAACNALRTGPVVSASCTGTVGWLGPTT